MTTANTRKILVAVDFGTTYSAIAWVQTRTNAKRKPTTSVIDDWNTGETASKVPTQLQWDGNTAKWGFGVNTDQKRYEWFKLEQDPNMPKHKLALAYPNTTIPPRDTAHLEKLITTYLKFLREHTEALIKGQLNSSAMDILKGASWEYIITVPAAWPEKAQDMTLRCAKAAGMAKDRDIRRITEPEAAGIYALDIKNRQDCLVVGDTFVICDAGGGTVDLISYTIKELGDVPKLAEATEGNGDLCGSTFLDRQFERWLHERLGGYPQWTPNAQMEAMKRWQTSIKVKFDGDVHKIHAIPVYGLQDNNILGIQGGNLQISGAEIEKLFEPIVRPIVRMVLDQIMQATSNGRPPKTVLLAGGFGMNEYLKKRIQGAVSGQGAEVHRMKDCNTAIVQGALITALAELQSSSKRPTISVASRISRLHYGIAAWMPYIEGTHDSGRQMIDGGADEGKRIEVISWFVDKGSEVMESIPRPFPNEYYFDEWENDVKRKGGKFESFKMPIYVYQADHGRPDYPPFSQTGSCKELGTLEADMNKIPKEYCEDHKQRGHGGRMCYKIPFKLEATFRSALMDIEIIYERKDTSQKIKCGKAVVVYE